MLPTPVLLAALLSVLLLSACQAPSLDRQAHRLGLEAQLAEGDGYQHVLYRMPGGRAGTIESDPVVVLLDGDGKAFLNRTTVARNPTATSSFILRLMPRVAPSADVIYLGRPCYGVLNQPGCQPRLWTTERYSAAVVASLAAVLDRQLGAEQPVLLVGYSGGGVLAALLAERRPRSTIGLITVAAPLGVDAWTGYHGYTALAGSLEPDLQLLAPLCQRHFLGSRDSEVPPVLAKQWTSAAPAAFVTVDANHSCCWGQTLERAIVELLAACR